MKKEESILGIISLILGLCSIFSMIHPSSIGFAVVSLILAIPAIRQKAKSKRSGTVGLILSVLVLLFWMIALSPWFFLILFPD